MKIQIPVVEVQSALISVFEKNNWSTGVDSDSFK